MNLPKIPLWAAATALLLVALSGAAWLYYQHEHARITWTMVHVSGDRYSGDAHLLEFPDGHIVLIDTGFDKFTRRDLIPYLDEHGIDHIDQIILSHAHRNHYGGILSLIGHLARTGSVYFNIPPESPCAKEPWNGGCDYQHVLNTRQAIRDAGVPLKNIATDDVIYQDPGRDIILEVAYVHDGVSRPIGNTDINDTSAVLRLVYGATTVLFTADLNAQVGEYLVKNDFPLKSDIMTAPHHGVEGAAGNQFLARVDPALMMVSNSSRVWLGPRGERMRQFAADHHIPVYVTGLNGNVVVSLTRAGYGIEPERRSPAG